MTQITFLDEPDEKGFRVSLGPDFKPLWKQRGNKVHFLSLAVDDLDGVEWVTGNVFTATVNGILLTFGRRPGNSAKGFKRFTARLSFDQVRNFLGEIKTSTEITKDALIADNPPPFTRYARLDLHSPKESQNPAIWDNVIAVETRAFNDSLKGVVNDRTYPGLARFENEQVDAAIHYHPRPGARFAVQRWARPHSSDVPVQVPVEYAIVENPETADDVWAAFDEAVDLVREFVDGA